MIEAVNQIRLAEENAEELKKTARRTAAAVRDDAEKRGRDLLDSESRRASAQAAEKVAEAQRQAKEYLEQSGEKSAGQCDELVAAAQIKMDEAAKLIVERIVSSL